MWSCSAEGVDVLWCVLVCGHVQWCGMQWGVVVCGKHRVGMADQCMHGFKFPHKPV